MLDRLALGARSPVRPLPRRVPVHLVDQVLDDLRRRRAGPPGAVEREDNNIDPLGKRALRLLDLDKLLPNVLGDALRPPPGTEGLDREFALAVDDPDQIGIHDSHFLHLLASKVAPVDVTPADRRQSITTTGGPSGWPAGRPETGSPAVVISNPLAGRAWSPTSHTGVSG